MIDSGESCMCICFVFNNNLSSITVFGEKKNVSMLWQMSLRDALKMSLSLTHKTHSKRDFVRAILSFYLFLFRAMRDRSKIESLQPHVILTTPNKWFYACKIASIPCHLTCHPSIPVGCSGLYFSNLIRRDWNWFFMMFCILCVCVLHCEREPMIIMVCVVGPSTNPNIDEIRGMAIIFFCSIPLVNVNSYNVHAVRMSGHDPIWSVSQSAQNIACLSLIDLDLAYITVYLVSHSVAMQRG